MNNGLGFNPELVNTAISKITAAYTDLMEALGTKMQNDYVNGMGECWACNAAQKFFNEAFAPAVDELITQSNTIFDSVHGSMVSAAQNWAAQTQTQYSGPSFSTINKKMDTSVIQENIGGVRGIDAGIAEGINGKLPTIIESANQALEQAAQATEQCGFLGGGQAEALAGSLRQIKTNIGSTAEGISTAAKNSVAQTIADYGDLAGRVSQAFNGQ